eukprot:gene4118-14222_t
MIDFMHEVLQDANINLDLDLGIPDYFTIIKEPVDLNSITTGIDSGAYSHFSQVLSAFSG